MILFLCDVSPFFLFWLLKVLLLNHLFIFLMHEQIPLVSLDVIAFTSLGKDWPLQKAWHLRPPSAACGNPRWES